MSHGAEAGSGHRIESMKVNYIVWVWLLVVTLIEVFLAYIHVPIHIMLIALIGLSIFKAALIISWFMHIKFERRSLVLTLIPALTICILLLNVVFPDSFRLKKLAVHRTAKAAGHAVETQH